jgi:predicted dehydrogenase
MWNNIRIGIIGKGSQFLRISKILKKKKLEFLTYKPKEKNYYNKKSFEDLKECNVIFILSPNKTHFQYINLLKKNRYIFCEKPPVTSLNDLKKLKKLNYKKIYFNYNFRFSKISEIFSDIKKHDLEELLYGTIISGHGLGLKKEYIRSWRSNRKLCKKGVFEIVSIHWIDLLNYHFSLKKIKILNLRNFLKKGNSYDNSYCKVSFKNKSEVDIYSSYTSPFIKKIILVFSNGTIEQNEDSIEIRGPAMNLDKNLFFIKPKLIKKIRISEKQDYNLSLEKSVDFFLNCVKKNKTFSKKIFNTSLNSNKLIL